MRRNTLTAEYRCSRHLTKHQLQSKGRQRNQRWAIEDAAQRRSEGSVRRRIWRDEVHRSVQRIGKECMLHRADVIVERDPAHPLLPGAHRATDAEPEWR